MKKIFIGFIVAAFTASIALAGPGQGMGRLAEKLNLSDAQKTQWKELRRSFHEENREFLEKARQTMHDLRAAREANDTAKVDSLKPLVESTRAQMKQLHEAQDQKVMAILTAEQQAQFQQLKAERQARRRQRP